jgi:large subunit ribosomal protein L25
MVVDMDKTTHATVPLHLVNDPEGVKAGGVLTVNLHEITVEALPADIPQGGIEVDVAALEIGDALHVSDIKIMKNVTIIDDPETIVCAVQAPRAEVEEEVSELAEPEVIGAKDEAE